MKYHKSIRLPDYDYNQNGQYFVTVCTKGMEQILSEICDFSSETVAEGFHALPQIRLTNIGKVIDETIRFMNKTYDYIKITHYVIMPNHIHLVVSIDKPDYSDDVGRGSPTLQEYIKRLKTYTTKQSGRQIWQRGFYDHIIRDDQDLRNHIQYIDENPKKWLLGKDKYYS